MPRVAHHRECARDLRPLRRLGVAFLYFVLPKLAGLGDTWHRLGEGDTTWLLIALGLECLSFAGYVVLFRTVFVRDGLAHRLPASYQITMAGLAATRLFAAAGAGDRAHRVGAAALGDGAPGGRRPDARLPGAALHRLRGRAGDRRPRALPRHLQRPGAVCDHGRARRLRAFAFLVAGAMACLPGDAERWIARRARRGPHPPAAGERRDDPRLGVDGHPHGDRPRAGGRWGVLGAVAWWGFDIAVLWACFHAYGRAAADRGDRDGLRRRDARQHAAAAGRHRGRRRRDDRRVRGVRRELRLRDRRGAHLPCLCLLVADAARRHRVLPTAPHRRGLARGARYYTK